MHFIPLGYPLISEGLDVELGVEHVLNHAAEAHHLAVAELVRRRGVERRQRGHGLGGGHPALEELRHPLLPVDAIAGAAMERSLLFIHS